MTTAATLLIAGFVVFMAGAAGWKLGYEAPLPERMHLLHQDRRRLRWIHSTMAVAMLLTPAGLVATAAVSTHPAAWAAALAYAIGAVPWLLNLTFRLTVQEWVAANVSRGSSVPDWYVASEAWMALGHRVHMLVSYGSAVPLAWALATTELIPPWLGWAGALWGVMWTLGYVNPRSRFAFEPPFWAHVFALAVGIALL